MAARPPQRRLSAVGSAHTASTRTSVRAAWAKCSARRDTRLGRDVALKILPAVWTADAQRRTRFEREARAVAALHHPNICTIHDVGHDQGIDFLVMELVDGESLADAAVERTVAARRRPSRARSRSLTRWTVRIAQGIIHRDLKPGNVMLTKFGIRRAASPGQAARFRPRARSRRPASEPFGGANRRHR